MLILKNFQLYQKSTIAVILQRALWLALALLLTLHVLPDRLWALEFDSGPPGTTPEAVRPAGCTASLPSPTTALLHGALVADRVAGATHPDPCGKRVAANGPR